MNRKGLVLSGVISLSFLACAETRDPPQVSGSRVDTLPGGLVRVTNNQSVWTPETAWRLEEDLRLGTIDDAVTEQQFGDIFAIITDPEDRLYVLDGQAQEIRVFNPDGSFAGVIGGPGEGPGELSQAAGLNLGPDGRLWVYDTGTGFHAFEFDGTFVARHRRLVRGVLYPWRGEFAPDGHLYDWGISYPGMSEGAIRDSAIFHPFRVSLDFETLDTLPTFEYRRDVSGQRPVPWGAGLSVYQDRHGAVWFAHTREYVVRRRTLEGDTTLVFSLPALAAPVTDAEADSVLAAQPELPAQFTFAAEDVPSEKPIIRRIFGDNAGRLYVVPELAGVPAGSVVDVFTTDGIYLGRMDLPARMSLPLPAPHATTTHLYVVTNDEFDVPYVSRMKIVRPE